MLKLYNTLTRKKEDFKPIKPGEAGLYCCGPTVYNYAHIGNLRSYIFEDILRRVLEFNSFDVNQVMNITDVGHLASDADEGEDKLMKALVREGKKPSVEAMKELARMYEDAFKKDIKMLNIAEPSVWCRATEHISDMIELIKRIDKNGYAYKTTGGLVFDTSKFKHYAELGKLKLEELKAGARIALDEEKKNPSDFALWITNQPNHLMQWESPFGKGFPGWHIECSAMSIKYLGEQFDIHCGGIDHIPVHHTNEIAQSEAATGKHPWVNYWLHGEFLIMEKGKMSKSSGEFLTLQVLMEKGYEPLVYRYFCLGAHYRQQLTFSFEALEAAKNAYEKLKARVIELKQKGEKGGVDDVGYLSRFTEAVNDDLNTPKALALMWDMLKDEDVGNKFSLLLEFDRVLGLGINEMKKKALEVPEEVTYLMAHRKDARKKKDWKLADEIRDKIKAKGFLVLDTPEGQKVEAA
ncbi:MAG: cysteine--tRNA ligase [Candidatus Nanoarchaeia archaeon]|nr:cysteine--tRNA ligase [Candidatus Nanoarchaeia archaeon]